MTERERLTLASEIRNELRKVTHGKLSSDAKKAAEAQARFLLATLAGKTVPFPQAKKKRGKKDVGSPVSKKPADDNQGGSKPPKFKSVRTYGPSPSKYLLPARGRTVSGGLPSLGRRS